MIFALTVTVETKDLGKQTNKLMEQIKVPQRPGPQWRFQESSNRRPKHTEPIRCICLRSESNDGTFTNPMDREEWQKIEDMKAVGNMVDQLDVRYHSAEAGMTRRTRIKLPSVPPLQDGCLCQPFLAGIRPDEPQSMRSNEVHKKFLAVDIMSLVSFTVDPNQPLPENATLQDFLAVCVTLQWIHSAHTSDYTRNTSTFYDSYHTSIGRIMDDRSDTEENECENKKEEECVRRGIQGLTTRRDIPARSTPRIRTTNVNDDRFSLAIVHWLHESLLGLAPLKPPKDRYHPYYREMVDAYIARHHEMERVRTIFVESGYNLRAAITAILNGRIYRIKKANFLMITKSAFMTLRA